MQVVTIETDPTQNGGSPIYGKIEKDTGITYESDKEGNPMVKPMQASGDSLGGEVQHAGEALAAPEREYVVRGRQPRGHSGILT